MGKPDKLRCPECGEEKPFTIKYWPKRSDYKYGLRTDRCRPCNWALIKERYPPKPKVIRHCEFCGDRIKPKPGQTVGNARTCHKPECQEKRRKKHLISDKAYKQKNYVKFKLEPEHNRKLLSGLGEYPIIRGEKLPYHREQ